MGGELCYDATLVSPLTRTGQPQPCAAAHGSAMLRVAERRKQTSTRSSARAVRSGSSSSGMRQRRGSSEPRRHCELRPHPPGQDGGGRLWL